MTLHRIAPWSRRAVRQLPIGLAVLLAACGGKGGPPVAAGPVEVGVITVTPRSVTLTREIPGRTTPYRIAEVRARVNGIILKRLFTEGSEVKEGQPLFLVDAAPYQAALDGARAVLARAEANLVNARLQGERYADLVKDSAVSQQEYEVATAALKAGEADVASARAAEQAARINLGYTAVSSPVSGRVGRAAVTEGAYVQAAQATLLATVQQLDPIYVDVTQSTAEVLKLRRDLEAGRLVAAGEGKAKVKLVTEDGREYPLAGALQFTDVTVDPGTGSVMLRALFPNPRGELLPGMFVRARLEEGINPQALLVPQVGVTRDQKGLPVAMVVNAEKKVERRQLVTDRAIGDAWLITEGLKPGEVVIVEGLQKVRPGVLVNPVPAASAR
jgi:membrane fusion protein (multidrug efflux system)